jgi:mitochondrial fission protein ELM1
MKSETPLKAAVFFDTRPGHIKQTLGILDSLEQLTEIQTIQIKLPHLSAKSEILKWIKYFIYPAKNCSADLEGCDFIIGTGSRTHIPMLACRKKYHIPVITCMAPTAILRAKFDLCFVPQHDCIQAADNIFLTDGPPNRSRSKSLHDPNRGLILIGGKDEKSHHWNDTAIINSVSFLLQQERNLTWTISSSPRTPAETNASLENLAIKFDNAHFIKFSDTVPGWIEKEYDKNKTVWVTADSVSMLFEARSAGCRVGVLPITWKRKNNKFQRCVDDLCTKELVVSFDAWKEGKARWTFSETLNEAQRCAREILKRWWPNRLQ